ncbi:unnamed protein product [Bursaphelenchus okinawaensis]|uniref:Uncharacterized protein n=1 Tax=Bursaphelenchus okinawaensis TaxID=465554 RepID=A0A811KT80_9BILA|nr:unnamed protein product [Bursaphelenchus okinawaensis]CAG9112186.1 unnamed protein product [Bursaphelenchus okinawaensis]
MGIPTVDMNNRLYFEMHNLTQRPFNASIGLYFNKHNYTWLDYMSPVNYMNLQDYNTPNSQEFGYVTMFNYNDSINRKWYDTLEHVLEKVTSKDYNVAIGFYFNQNYTWLDSITPVSYHSMYDFTKDPPNDSYFVLVVSSNKSENGNWLPVPGDTVVQGALCAKIIF